MRMWKRCDKSVAKSLSTEYIRRFSAWSALSSRMFSLLVLFFHFYLFVGIIFPIFVIVPFLTCLRFPFLLLVSTLSTSVGYDKAKGAGLNSKLGLLLISFSSLIEKRLFIVCFRVDRRNSLSPSSSSLLDSTGFTIRTLKVSNLEKFSFFMNVGTRLMS